MKRKLPNRIPSIPGVSLSDPLGARGAELYGGPTISTTMVPPHGPSGTHQG